MSVGYLRKCSSNGKPKKSHPTQGEAEGHRQAMISAGRWTAAKSNTYFCNQCGGYHAGSTGQVNRGGGRQIAKNRPRWTATQ